MMLSFVALQLVALLLKISGSFAENYHLLCMLHYSSSSFPEKGVSEKRIDRLEEILQSGLSLKPSQTRSRSFSLTLPRLHSLSLSFYLSLSLTLSFLLSLSRALLLSFSLSLSLALIALIFALIFAFLHRMSYLYRSFSAKKPYN